MITENSNQAEIVNELSTTVTELENLATAVDETKFNQVPYEGSWTASQLLDHVTKSINGMAHSIRQPGKAPARNAGEKITGLKKMFLNMDSKMKSPEMLIPGEGPFLKKDMLKALTSSLDNLLKATKNMEMSELVEGLPFGPTTKLELLHFVVYHTMRHTYQMKKICTALGKIKPV